MATAVAVILLGATTSRAAAQLVDVHPDGTAVNLNNGIQRQLPGVEQCADADRAGSRREYLPVRGDLGSGGGRPRIVEQMYLVGTEEEVIARLTAGRGGDPSLPETEHVGSVTSRRCGGCGGWTRSR